MAAALADMIADTCRYAKRQLTWFRRDPQIAWFDAGVHAEAALGAACSFVVDRVAEGGGDGAAHG